jgi:DNA-binding LacI/PurR family transcriptional regulator
MRAPSQTQLTRKLRLSRATVSRTLANHPALSAYTRARVQTLAAELGYRGTPTRSVRRPADAPPLKLGVLIGTPLVPADVSLTGFDGQDAPPGLPRLTSLAVSNADLGASAVARLVGRLLQPSSPRRVPLVMPRLVEGETIAPPKLAT